MPRDHASDQHCRAFDSDEPQSDFRLLVPYFEPFRYELPFERDGLEMTFAGMHRPLAAYTDALAEACFLIETIREPVPDDDLVSDMPEMARQRKVPAFLHLRATGLRLRRLTSSTPKVVPSRMVTARRTTTTT